MIDLLRFICASSIICAIGLGCFITLSVAQTFGGWPCVILAVPLLPIAVPIMSALGWWLAPFHEMLAFDALIAMAIVAMQSQSWLMRREERLSREAMDRIKNRFSN